MAGIEVYSDLPQTQVSSGGTDAPAPGTSQSWTVAASGGFPTADSDGSPPTQFHVSDPAQASEIILVTDNTAGLVWTVTRGAEGTTPVAHTAGFTIKQVVTAGGLGALSLPLYAQPYGCTAASMARSQASNTAIAPASGTLCVTSLVIPQYTVVSNLTFVTGGTAETGGTHGWHVLLDSTLKVVAVSADQTGAAVWSPANTPITLAATSAYTTTYTGLYYIGVMVVATGMPTFNGSAGLGTSGAMGQAPVFCGTSSTGQTTPPAIGTTMTALTAASFNFYAYTS